MQLEKEKIDAELDELEQEMSQQFKRTEKFLRPQIYQTNRASASDDGKSSSSVASRFVPPALRELEKRLEKELASSSLISKQEKTEQM